MVDLREVSQQSHKDELMMKSYCSDQVVAHIAMLHFPVAVWHMTRDWDAEVRNKGWSVR